MADNGKQAHEGARLRGVTPIPLSPRAAVALAVLVLASLVAVFWFAPSALYIALGGGTLALVLSFPVSLLSRVMRRGLAVLLTALVLLGLVALALGVLVPLIVDQLGALISSLPQIAADAEDFFRDARDALEEREVLPEGAEGVLDDAAQNLFDRARDFAQNLLSGLVGFVSSAFSLGVILFGIVVVAIYAVLDIRRIKAAYLLAVPHAYRRDARELWEDFDASLSRYLGGLAVVSLVEGVLSGLALWLIGVPYAVVLGAFVAVVSTIPYIGPWLGALPALVVSLFVSPTAFVLTALAFLAIQQLEGNVLTPRIQGQAVGVHPIVVLIVVVAAAQLAGLLGAVFAVPALAVVRVIVDFLRARLYIKR